MKAALVSLLAVLTVAFAGCGKKAADNTELPTDETVTEEAADAESEEEITEQPVDTDAATVTFDEPTPISEEEADKVEEYLFSQLGGNHPEEEQFGFSFPIQGTVDIGGKRYYIGSWEMRLYNEMGEESSSQVIMDFMLPTDYSAMYEIYGENGSYNVYLRDVLKQN